MIFGEPPLPMKNRNTELEGIFIGNGFLPENTFDVGRPGIERTECIAVDRVEEVLSFQDGGRFGVVREV